MSWKQKTKDTVHDEKNIKGFFGEYRWLSNFEPCLVEHDGLVFPSSEAAYQAAKCKNKEDRLLFLTLSAAESKKMGRKIKIIDHWDDVKDLIMKAILISKFTKNSHLREKLLDTGDKYLEETNWWNDRYWGVCNGRGDNMLGKILMEVRDQIEVA